MVLSLVDSDPLNDRFDVAASDWPILPLGRVALSLFFFIAVGDIDVDSAVSDLPITYSAGVVCRDWGAIFRESSRVLYEEVDYTREGENAERFSDNFKGTDWIKAPSINWSRSTDKVNWLC